MALTSLTEFLLLPNNLNTYISIFSADVLDAVNERGAMVFPAWKAGNIHTVGIRVGSVATGDTLKISVQGVNSSHVPDGTILGAGGAGYTTIVVGSGDDDTWKTGTLGADVTVTQGQQIAIVVEWNSYVSGNMQFPITVFGTTYNCYNMYRCTDQTATPGTWITQSLSTFYGMIVQFDDNTYLPPFGGALGVNLAISTATTPDEVGNYITMPVPCRACGIWVCVDLDYAATVSLQNTSGTTLANAVVSPDYRKDIYQGNFFCLFDADPAPYVDLTAGTSYRVVFTPTTGSNDSIPYILFPAAAALASHGLGTSCIYTARTDAGAWAETDTRRVAMGLIISHVDDGAGGVGSETIKGRSGSGAFLGMGKGN